AEELREAGHVDALPGGVEIDGAVDVRSDQLLAPRVRDPDRLADSGDACAGEPEADFRRRGLQVVCEKVPFLHVFRPGYVVRPARLARVPRSAHAARDRARVRADDRADGGARGAAE